MPRQSRSSRPAARPAAPVQSRGAHTAAAPMSSQRAPSAAQAPASPTQAGQAKQPGMMAQMAATAGSVAIGSTIGHGLSSMLFGGGGGSAPVEQQQPVQQQQQGFQQGVSCEVQAKDFTKCLEKADMNSCSWYLEQLKACQSAAAPY